MKEKRLFWLTNSAPIWPVCNMASTRRTLRGPTWIKLTVRGLTLRLQARLVREIRTSDCLNAQIYVRRQKCFGEKYESVTMDNGYNKYMMLKVRSVSKGDFGSYKCVAKNSLGETDGLIKLDGEYKCVCGQELTRGDRRTHQTGRDSGAFHDVHVHSHSRHDAHLFEEESVLFSPGSVLFSPGSALFSPGSVLFSPGSVLFSPGSVLFSPGSALFSPGSALFSPGSVLFSPGSALFSPGQRYRKQWKPRLEGGNRSRDYEVEGWRDSGKVEV
uniref:Immunoglobulin I-set domain-containing protein n=1 Tax=Timema genevievae TaxID=629358 RepID=A0A7R9K9Q4_TIMGE|nr:unnamed protein product [Timema genevievae]